MRTLTVMHTTRTTPVTASWTKAAKVIVDWSGEKEEMQDASVRMQHLLEWVRTYPQRAAVHVVLRRSRQVAQDRALQSRLQSMGWTVTMRSAQPQGVAA